MSAPVSPLFIVNPIAGSGRAHGYTPRIEAWMAEQGIDGRLLETRERGHAERLAAAATDLGHDRVIAVGGDGTIQEVLNGLLTAGAAPDGGPPSLGIIPAGRGNDLARSVFLPLDPMACLPIAVGATGRRFDVGKATSEDGAVRYFGAAGGVGFDAEVAYTMAVRRRFWMRGEAGYFLGTLNELRRFHNSELRITLRSDGEDRVVDQRFLFVAFANGPYSGGGVVVRPDAGADGGPPPSTPPSGSRFAARTADASAGSRRSSPTTCWFAPRACCRSTCTCLARNSTTWTATCAQTQIARARIEPGIGRSSAQPTIDARPHGRSVRGCRPRPAA